MPERELIRQFLQTHGLARLADTIVADLVPSIAIRLTRLQSTDPAPIGATKFGGGPDLPDDPSFAWPSHGGVEHRFIAQINLSQVAELWPESPLPKAGLISFFFDDDKGWFLPPTSPPGWRIFHITAPTASLRRRADPWAAKPERRGLFARLLGRKPSPIGQGYWPCSATLRRVWTLPDLLSRPGTNMELTDEESDALYGDLVEELDTLGLASAGHRLLGAPTPIQGPVELTTAGYSTGAKNPDWDLAESDAPNWRLLLQVDSDDAPGFCFGDWGSLYFMLRSTDLATHRWDRVFVVPECY
jgi:uncharacterized protein YwqG